MTMKLYVAGKWEERKLIRERMDELEKLGHSITFDWTSGDELDPSEKAQSDLQGVLDCDATVLILENDLPYKGAYVEFGIALGSKKKIYVIGNSGNSCIFMNLPYIKKFKNWKAFIFDIKYEYERKEILQCKSCTRTFPLDIRRITIVTSDQGTGGSYIRCLYCGIKYRVD